MNRIRALREDMDLRQEDVAQATGIAQKTLSNYETGKTNPDSYAIIRLASFFGVSTDYLLGVEKNDDTNEQNITQELEKIRDSLKRIENMLKK